LLAFAMHTVCDIADALWRNARNKLGPRYNFFGKLAAITTYLIFASWEDLLLTLAFARTTASPSMIRPPNRHAAMPSSHQTKPCYDRKIIKIRIAEVLR